MLGKAGGDPCELPIGLAGTQKVDEVLDLRRSFGRQAPEFLRDALVPGISAHGVLRSSAYASTMFPSSWGSKSSQRLVGSAAGWQGVGIYAASTRLSRSISRSHASSWFQLGTIWDALIPESCTFSSLR